MRTQRKPRIDAGAPDETVSATEGSGPLPLRLHGVTGMYPVALASGLPLAMSIYIAFWQR